MLRKLSYILLGLIILIFVGHTLAPKDVQPEQPNDSGQEKSKIQPEAISQSCQELYQSTPNPPSMFVPLESIDLNNVGRTVYDADRVCFRGHDISAWVAGKGMEINAAAREIYGPSSAIISTTSINGDETEPDFRSELILISLSPITGEPIRQVIATRHPNNDPFKSVDGYTIAGFDKNSRILYFEAPSWATAFAIRAIDLPDKIDGELHSRFIIDGSLESIVDENDPLPALKNKGGDLVVGQSKVPPEGGRISFTSLVSPKGKVLCDIDEAKDNYKVYPICKNGEFANDSAVQTAKNEDKIAPNSGDRQNECVMKSAIFVAAAAYRNMGATPQMMLQSAEKLPYQKGVPLEWKKWAINEVYFDPAFTYAGGDALQTQMYEMCLHPEGKYQPLK